MYTTSTIATNTTSISMLAAPAPDEENGFNIHTYFTLHSTGMQGCNFGAVITFISGTVLSYILPAESDAKFNPKLLSPIVHLFVRYELAQID